MESGDETAALLMYALGGLFAFVAAAIAAARLRFRARARRVHGVVVAHRRGSKRDGVIRFAPIVEYQVNGRTLRHSSGLFGTGTPSIGSEIEVYVHPDDPEIVELRGWSGSWTAAGVLGFIGLVLALLGLSF